MSSCLSISGIADSRSFLLTLDTMKIPHKKNLTFGDHHRYTKSDVEFIYKVMKKNECDTIITTTKDFFKLNALNYMEIKIYILNMKMEFNNSEQLLSKIYGVFD